MTPEKLLLLAEKAGMSIDDPENGERENVYCGGSDYPIDAELLKFAELVIAEEREACAAMADEHGEPDLARNIMARE